MSRTAFECQTQKLKEVFLGKKISNVEIRDRHVLSLRLESEDGTLVEIANEGSIGADSNWYDALTVRANGRIVFQE